VDTGLTKLGDKGTLTKFVQDFNAHLAMRTFFAGYRLTAADIAVWSGLISEFLAFLELFFVDLEFFKIILVGMLFRRKLANIFMLFVGSSILRLILDWLSFLALRNLERILQILPVELQLNELEILEALILESMEIPRMCAPDFLLNLLDTCTLDTLRLQC
jgi:hypothetical protein